MPAVIAIATFLHMLATVVVVGHYLLLGFVYLPGLRRRLRGTALVAAVDEMDLAARPWLIGAFLVFGITGTVLMFVNPAYTGWVGLVGNPWAVLLLAKHALVALVIVAAIVLEVSTFPAAVDVDSTEDERVRALARLLLALRAMAAAGVLVLLLTAAAQEVAA